MKTALSLLLCLSLLTASGEFSSISPSCGIAASAITAERLPDPPEPVCVLSCISAAPSEAFCAENARVELGEEICEYALQYVGYDYLWGGTSPETGFDCSGFVQYIYSQFGYSLNRIAEDQALNGEHVDEGDIRPGDLLCFYSSKTYIGHVGIYLGDRLYIHAQSAKTGVVVSDLDDPWLPRVFEARRIV